eukprot:GHVT01069363.1.p1 GENE.GHVT01069363.1~~GHVT01069363.1.p1  ORF type:complete len:126 (+),score=12.04 GHVT01069363.1:253-630(+)
MVGPFSNLMTQVLARCDIESSSCTHDIVHPTCCGDASESSSCTHDIVHPTCCGDASCAGACVCDICAWGSLCVFNADSFHIDIFCCKRLHLCVSRFFFWWQPGSLKLCGSSRRRVSRLMLSSTHS